MILSELAPLLSAQHGVFYTLATADGGEPLLRYQAGYGFKERKHLASEFRVGEGLVGQCAHEKERIVLTDVPGDYVTINSGLGEATPLNIVVLPILFEGSVRVVVELASFTRFSLTHQAFLDQLTESIGLVLNTIEANTLTENLLKQSQSQAQELQSRQEDLRASNEDLAKQASRLAEQNIEVEAKSQEVRYANRLIEEKAEQLAVSSAFKSEFFANMSHELRTPLNNLLILAVEMAPSTPAFIATDPGRRRQVLKNLLANAFKFIDHGEVTLRIGPPDTDWRPANGQIGDASAVTAFSISDTGVGIAPELQELQELIFEAFAQADGTTARQYGGTGLGLSISRGLVGLLGGEMGLTSTLGEGSTFTVYLPLRPDGEGSPSVGAVVGVPS
jgi:signal transduction histidine kinase